MKKDKVAPICEIEIVNAKNVKKARKRIADTENILDIAETFKLLGEPTRLKIVMAITECELCVCDLASAMESNISTISHQLRLLRNAKIVKYRKEGKMVYYSADDKHISDIIEIVKEHTKEG